ncbi:MAG: c-type cytochrome [Alphaproteobacteria bacterium]
MKLVSSLGVAAALGLLAAPALAQEGDPAAGQQVFNQCRACHIVEADRPSRPTGPNLYEVIDREIASREDYAQRPGYSDAYLAKKEEGFTWTKENLAEYLADPRGYIPGNRMAFNGLRSEEQINDVIAYIERESQ